MLFLLNPFLRASPACNVGANCCRTKATNRFPFKAPSIAAGIPVTRGGTLELTFAPDVNLAGQIGRTIDLFDWTGVNPTSAFTVSRPYSWNLSKLYTTGEITLAAVPGFPGDFNNNGVVDAADYVVWRNNDGTQTSYDVWRAHFGTVFPGIGAGSGAALPSAEPLSAVPEPASVVLCLFAAIGSLVISRKWGRPKIVAEFAAPVC